MLNLETPTDIRTALAAADKSTEFRNSSNGAHLFSLVGLKTPALVSDDFIIPKLLFYPGPSFHQPDSPTNTTYFTQLASLAFAQAKAILHQHSEFDFRLWRTFTKALALSFNLPHSFAHPASALNHGLPFVERILDHIDALRASREWQTNPRRSPPFLPPTTELRIFVALKGVLLIHDASPLTERNRAFAVVLAELIREYANAGPAAYDAYPHILFAAKKREASNYATVAGGLAKELCTGEKLVEMKLENYWAVDLVSGLVREAKWPESRAGEEDVRFLKRVLEEWRESGDERVRMEAERVRVAFRGKGGDEKVGRGLFKE